MQVRRVVTGHDADGKSVFVDDSKVDAITLDLLPGYAFHRLWGTDEVPTFPDDGQPRPAVTYFPPVHGHRFGIFTVPGGSQALPEDLDVPAALAEMEAALPGMAAHMEPDSPGMHTTATIDYEYVVSGEIVLELDDGVEVLLRAGDTVVQNGTRHAWRNRGEDPCVIVVVLIGANRSD